jgi:hypothetical protein
MKKMRIGWLLASIYAMLSLPAAGTDQRRGAQHAISVTLGQSDPGSAYFFPSIVSFEGVDATDQPTSRDVDPQGAVGTKQFFEWTNANVTQGGMQAWDKVTLAPVWPQYQDIAFPWIQNGMADCETVRGDGQIIFDSVASRWVIGGHSSSTGKTGPYFYCVAVSSTDDLAASNLTWYTYEFPLDPYLGTDQEGNPNFPDWPKISTWWNAYFVTIDVEDPDDVGGNEGAFMPLGVLVCALDRTNMLQNNAAAYQCFTDPNPIPPNPTIANLYLMHSLIPADVDGAAAPPASRDEFLLSIQNPPNDLKTTTSNTINLWDFHLDWSNSQNSSLTRTSLTVPTYTPGCYATGHPWNTFCVSQPTSAKTHEPLDSVGDRLMPRLAYRNFGSYESFLISHTVQTAKTRQTGLRWYELRDNGSGSPSLYQSGTVNYGKTEWRFVPGIDQDQTGNAAIGYSLSSKTLHPGIYASSWSLNGKKKPSEFTLWRGKYDSENTSRWGSYTGMTVDPVDGCTFWYVNEYLPSNQKGSVVNWNTRISNFKLPSCH